MGRIVERNGQAFLVEGDKIVAVASSVEELLPKEESKYVASLHDRVEWQGHLGEVVRLNDSLYGRVAAVRLDSGDYVDVLADELQETDIPNPQKVASAVAQDINERFAAYEQMSVITGDDILARLEEARALKLEATAMLTDNLPLGEKIKLDRIVSTASVDIYDLQAQLETFELEIEPVTEVRIAVSEAGGTEFTRSDASWLETLATEVDETPAVDIAREAVALVDKLPIDSLEDDEVFGQALAFSVHQSDEFKKQAAIARMSRVASVKEQQRKMAKTASTTSSEEEIQMESLFLS